MISKATIDEIKTRMDVEEVVSDFVTLKRKGKDLWACCPFHDEKTPSFSVSPQKNFYKCFGCGKSGDAITFIMEMDGLSYTEALKYLAGKYGIEIEENEATDEEKKNQDLKESLFIALNEAKDYFIYNLTNTDEGKNIALTYLKERGFNDEIIKAFDLGYSLNEWESFKNQSLKKGYSQEILLKSGLIIENEQGKIYDRFRGRIIFPIHNQTGKVIAFGGRILAKNKNLPKYINSPETELYAKSNVLYGIYQAKQHIRNDDLCYLVEGYTDVISLHQAGIKNVVASSGTSLTTDQIKLISRFTKNITVVFDGDAAGMKASLRGIDMILEGGINVRVIALPENEDPDSYAKKMNVSALRSFFTENQQDFISFKTQLLLSDSKHDPVKKSEAIKEIVQSISKIPDAIQRTMFVRDCSIRLEVEEDILVSELNKILIKNYKKTDYAQAKIIEEGIETSLPEAQKIGLNLEGMIELQERESIRILLNYGDQIMNKSGEGELSLTQYILNELEEINFINPLHRQVIEAYKSELLKGKILKGNYFLNHKDQNIRQLAVDLQSGKYGVSDLWQNRYHIYIPKENDILKNSAYTNVLRLKLRILQKMESENSQKIRMCEDEFELDELLKEQVELKKISMEVSKTLGVVALK
ncbi:MAG TPA: DNA primase [Cyclobacteriaceae bacterium]